MHVRFTRASRGRKALAGAVASIQLESLESRQLLSSYYVSPTGDDAGAGTLADPWQTAQHAVDAVSSGDVINLRGGAYDGGIRIRKPNITLQAYNGEHAAIVAPVDNPSILNAITFDVDASGGKLINLDVSGGYYYAVKTESLWDTGAPLEYAASNILISGCKLHDTGRDVVKLTPSSDNVTIENTEIYNSGRRDPSNAEGIDGVNADNFILRDSYVHNTTTNGVYLKGGSIGTVIERNRISHIAHSGIVLGQSSDENLFDTSVDPLYYESIDGTVRNNIITGTGGAGIAAWAALRGSFYNNTMIDVAQSMMGGILITGQEHWIPSDHIVPSTDITLANNIVVVNSSRPVFDIRADGLTGTLTTSNNIYYHPGGAARFWDERTGFDGNLAQWQAAYGDAGSIEADPQIDSTSNYHLFATSPAINAGRTVSGFANDYDRESRPASTTWDIGADEYGGAVVTPPPVPEPPPPPPPPPAPDPIPSMWNNHSITTQTGDFTAEFDATPGQAGEDVVIGLSNGAADAYSDLAAIIRFNSSNLIDARNGGSYAATAAFAYAPNTSYHFKLLVHPAQQRYDVYVTSPGKSPVLLGQGFAFRTEQSSLTAINNWAKYNDVGNATISNFKAAAVILPAPPPDPTPVSAWVNHPFTNQSTSFVAEFDATPTRRYEDSVVGLAKGPASSYSNLAAIVRFNSGGLIDARNGGTYSAALALPYVANSKYHFKLVVDPVQHNYNIYVTPPGGTPVLLGRGFAFRTEQSALSAFSDWAQYSESGGVNVAKFVVTAIAAPPQPPPAPTPTGSNLALGRPATASSTNGASTAASNITDGDTHTRWASAESDPQWISVDLGDVYNINRVVLNWEYASAKSYQIQVSNDGVNWTTISSTTTGAGGIETVNASGTGRYVRMYGTQRNTGFGYSLYELQVFGNKA